MKESESILLLGLCICRDAVLTQVLKDALHSITCRAVILSHVTCDVTAYTETLTTLQLASRVHRMRRRRTKMGTSGVSQKYIRPTKKTPSLKRFEGPWIKILPVSYFEL